MNPLVGWSLAAVALAAGWFSYRWQGLALAATIVVFWLLLQFNRSVRVMRDASGSPVGTVPSAVMLHSRLRPGMTMLEVVKLTKSLGRRIAEAPETWAWADASGARVAIELDAKGRCARWTLERPAEP